MSRLGYSYNFPATRWAGNATYREQMEKIYEEVGELHDAIASCVGTVPGREDYHHMRVDALDIVCAVETFLRHFDQEDVDRACREVVEKNAARGYFR